MSTRMKNISIGLEETQNHIREDKCFRIGDSIYDLSIKQIKEHIEVLENLLRYPKSSIGNTSYISMKIIPALKYVLRRKEKGFAI